MAWQVFSRGPGRGGRGVGEPRVTISPRGMALLNAAAVAAHGREARFVELCFDPGDGRMAIRLLAERTPPALTLGSSGKRPQSSFSMRGFLISLGRSDLFGTRHRLMPEGDLLVLERVQDPAR